MEPALAAVAAGQQGMFTTAQAHRAGLGDLALSALVRHGECLRLARGLYAIGGAGTASGDDAAAHLQLATGGLLLYPDAALSHESALLAHDLPVWRPDRHRARLTRPVRHQVRRQHFVIDPWVDPVVRTSAGPAVAVNRALVQVARDRGTLSAVVAADQALRLGLVSKDQLATAVAAVAGWPHASRAESMLALADGRSESVGESRLRVLCLVSRIDVEPQVVVHDEHGVVVARLDLKVPGVKVGLEFDGRVKYRDRGHQALWEEKLREDRLRRLGYVIVRVTWADLDDPRRLLARLREAVLLARRVA